MKPLVEQDEILGVLQGFNPWWRGADFAAPPFKRLAFHACRRYLLDEELRRAVLLSGPRRVGKTTILHQMAAELVAQGSDPRSVLYLSLDHPILKLLPFAEVLKTYHAAIHSGDAKGWLLLDEVQYSKDWETEIKLLVDHRPNLRILATGSASVAHRDRLAESGVGRWITVPIPTLSFYEFVQLRQEEPPEFQGNLRPSDLFSLAPGELADIAGRLAPLLPSFQRYLLVGGFPETARQSDIMLSQRLLREDIVERVLKRDLTALFGVRNVQDVEKLFIYLCRNSGGIIPHKTCADALGVSPTTVGNHLELLEQANLVYRLPPSGLSGKRVLKARNKYYLVDAALRNAILLRGEEILGNTTEMGCIVETTVLRHVFAYYYRDTPAITYWRDPATEREVDMVVTSPAYTIPIEVKYKERPDLDARSGLVVYCTAEGIGRAFCVTKADRDFKVVRLGDQPVTVLLVPAHILTYLLGRAERLLWDA